MKRLFKNPRRTGFISIFLTLLGLSTSGCLMPLMYGSPYADWSVKGKVVDEDNKPISGLQVVLANYFENTNEVIYDQNRWPLDTLQTAGDGTYYLESNGVPIHQLEVHVQDIDGELRGGEFEDAQLIVKQIEYKDGKDWYSGHADIRVPDIILKKK